MFPFILSFIAPKNLEVSDKGLLVCYGKLDPSSIKGYEIVILEAGHYSKADILRFRENNKKVVAYISLTEINKSAVNFNDLLPFTIGTNEIWKSCYINLREDKARSILLAMVKALVDKGFNGLFMDNMDNVSTWGPLSEQSPELIALVKEIRIAHEDLFLMQNAGLSLTADLNGITNAILVESLFSLYDFDTKKYGLRDSIGTEQLLRTIKGLRKSYPNSIYVLEYANTMKIKTLLTKKLDSVKLGYYVSQIDLQDMAKFHQN